MIIGIILLNNRSIRVDKRMSLSLIYRAFCGFLGGLLFLYYLIEFKSNLSLGLIVFILWGISLVIGGYSKRTLQLLIHKRYSEKKNSWTHSYFLSFILILVLAILDIENMSFIFLLYALAINYAYLGSKVVCYLTNCCSVHKSIYRKNQFSLQKREFYTSFIICSLGIPFLFFDSYLQLICASLMLFSHGMLRWYAGCIRFPYKLKIAFIKDLSVTLIIVSSIIPIGLWLIKTTYNNV
jgi:hypothetical protein